MESAAADGEDEKQGVAAETNEESRESSERRGLALFYQRGADIEKTCGRKAVACVDNRAPLSHVATPGLRAILPSKKTVP